MELSAVRNGCTRRKKRLLMGYHDRHDPADNSYSLVGRRIADMAVQRWMGLLPEQWAGFIADHCYSSTRLRSNIGPGRGAGLGRITPSGAPFAIPRRATATAPQAKAQIACGPRRCHP